MEIKSFSGEYEFLSNFYLAPVNYKYNFSSAEAAYQAQKATSFEDAIKFKEYNPGKAKRMGRKIKIRSDWEEVKNNFMRDVVFAKFFQNPELAALLLATGDSKLIEGNYWHDIFWGVDSETDEGQNNLGKILMEIREELKNPEVALPSCENVLLTRFTVPEDTKCHWSPPEKSFIDLEFNRKYELKHKDFNRGIDDCKYKFRDRTFIDLDFRNGNELETLFDNRGIVQKIMAYDDGKKFFYQSNDIPVFDSGDALWDNICELVIFREGEEIVMIRSQHGWNIPSIEIYVGLKTSEPLLERILARLE